MFGIRFLVLVILVSHCCKGFCRAQYSQSIRYLLQSWMVPGPTIDAWTATIEAAWSMKPLVALCSDLFPLGGFRKMPYMAIATSLGLLGLGITSLVPDGLFPPQVSVVGLFLANFGWMTSDILVEGLFARRLASDPHIGPDFVIFISMGQQLAFLLSSVVSGQLLVHLDGAHSLTGAQWNLATCMVPSMLMLYPTLANFGGEPRVSPAEAREARRSTWMHQKEVVVLSLAAGGVSLAIACGGITLDLGANVCVSVILLVVLTSLLWASFTPVVGRLVLFLTLASVCNVSIAGPAHYFYTDKADQFPGGPNLEPWFFVTVCGFAGAIAALVALGLYSKFSKSRYRIVYLVLIVLNGLLSAPNSIVFARLNRQWGISDYVFVGVDTALASAMAALLFTPGLLLLSRVCPDKLESSMFAILSSNMNLATTVSVPLSGLVCMLFGITPDGSVNEASKFGNLWIVNLVMVGIKLLPLSCIFLLPNLRMVDQVDGVRESVTEDSPIRLLWRRYSSRTSPNSV